MMGEAKLGRHLILIFHVKEIPLNLLYTKEATWGTDGGGGGWWILEGGRAYSILNSTSQLSFCFSDNLR